jgi:hypothetical protein
MRRAICALAFVLGWLSSAPVAALVKYDEGRRIINGVQLLQDASDSTAYYYLPQFPRLSTKSDGTLELLCLKYVDAANGTHGGLFHALVEFTLPSDVLDELEKKLKTQVPGGRIVGPVPLMQVIENGEEGVGAFQIVSATLTDPEKGGFARSVITSGKAPLMPGSKAVVAALLNQQGATLLWDSLNGPTSDVSVAIHAYYEAQIQAYNASVSAEVETLYNHFSLISNVQHEYTRRQIRDVVDDLRRRGTLKVEVLDRTAGLGLKASEMEGLLQIVTDKLIELMFNAQTGWSADPQRETAVEANQILGRQERGWFSSVFGGAQDTKYFTDDQWVLKNRKDVRQNKFSLVLGKSTTIKVPVDTAGNLGGLYGALGQDRRYFRIVNLADPAFEFRPVHFQVDGEYVDGFQDTFNFVSVNFRKSYPDKPAFTRSLQFTANDLKAGTTIRDVAFPRLDLPGADWVEYEYQVRWSLRDGPTLAVPPKEDQWVRTVDAAVDLVPPLEKRVVEIDADRQVFLKSGIASAVVEFATVLAGKPRLQRGKAVLRATDAAPTTKVAVYHDRSTPIAVRVSWHAQTGQVDGKLELLESDYLYLTPPANLNSPANPNSGNR